MEMIGTVESQPERTWYRCTRCRHASLLDTGEWKRTQEEAKRKVDKSECLEYRPSMTYTVGRLSSIQGLMIWVGLFRKNGRRTEHMPLWSLLKRLVNGDYWKKWQMTDVTHESIERVIQEFSSDAGRR
jgi:hypothetical protein